MTFLIREKKGYGTIIEELINYIEEKQLDINSDAKKSFIWLFWNNNSIISPRVIDLICKLSEDEDREVRRLSCEILVQFANDSRFSYAIFETLEKRITDESWRVQRVAIKCLLQSTQNIYQEDEHFWTKVVGLFWNTSALVRKNVCETLPLWIPITEEKNKIFLEMIENALADENWEVRESAAISLNKFLDLDLQYKNLIYPIMNLTNDPHPEVRKTSCQILIDRDNAFNNKNDLLKIIIELLNDSSFIVRETAIKGLKKLIHEVNSEKLFDLILKILLKLLIDNNIEVRAEAWSFLYDLMGVFHDSHFDLLISSIINFQNPLDQDIQLNICSFLKKCKKFILENNPPVFHFLKPMLKDNNEEVLENSWEICRTIFPQETRDYIVEILPNIQEENESTSKFLKEVFWASHELNLIKTNQNISTITIQVLESSNDQELQIIILKILYNYEDDFISPELIHSIINQGRWIVQEACIPYIIRYCTQEDIKDQIKTKFLRMINELLRNPIDRFESLNTESLKGQDTEYEKLFLPDNISNLIDSCNDDQRLKNWILLERKFDFLQKTSHPIFTQLTEDFCIIFLPELRKYTKKLNLIGRIGEKNDIKMLMSILQIMIIQQAQLREKLLNEIMISFDLINPKYKSIRKQIIENLLIDSILNIRTISWKIVLDFIFKLDETQLLDNLPLIADHLDSQFEDARIRALSILLSEINIRESSYEWIFNKVIQKISDPTFFVRSQVWNYLRKKIDISYSRYDLLKLKILDLLADANIDIRNEAFIYFDEKYGTFNEIISEYSHKYEVKHAIATVLGQQGKHDEAFSFFKENIKNNPSKLESWLGLVLIYLSKNEIQNATRILNKLQDKHPLEIIIYELLIECAIEANDLDLKKIYEEKKRLLEIL